MPTLAAFNLCIRENRGWQIVYTPKTPYLSAVIADMSSPTLSVCWFSTRYILPVSLLLILSDLYAQPTFGIKSGINLSRMITRSDTAGWDAYGISPSIHLGAFASLPISPKLNLGAEFLISDKGFRSDGDAFFGASHLLYINIPAYADIKVAKSLSVQIGPEVGLLATAWGKHKDYLSALYSNRFDLNVVAGLRYDVTNAVGLSIRFEQGLSNVVGKDASVLLYSYGTGDPVITGQNLRDRGVVHRNQTIQLSVSFSFTDEP